MKKTILSFLLTLFCAVLSVSCEKQTAAYSLTITDPSDDNLPMNTQRDFYIGGKINITGGSTVPEDAQVTVELIDASGTALRSVHSVAKGSNCLYAFHKKMHFSQEDDPDRVSAIRYLAPEFTVKDTADPLTSFADASIKCTFNDEMFRALIIYASDVEHGRLLDTEVRFVNHDGSTIEALPKGSYTIRAKLLDAGGNLLAQAEKEMVIDDPTDSILGRFHPEETYQRLLAMQKKMGLAANIDWIPGFVLTDNGDTNGFRSMFAGNDIAIYANSKTHALIYDIEPASSSYRLELAYLQSAGRVGDPDLFQAYHYDIGEPVLRFADAAETPLEGKIIPFTQGKLLDLCRVDVVNSATIDGIFATDGINVLRTDTDLSDGVEIEVGERFAISGALCPYQLAEGEVYRDADGLYKQTNNYSTIVITFDDGVSPVSITANSYMIRYNSNLTAQSVLCYYEFYRAFYSGRLLEAGKTYRVSLQAYDCYTNPIEGAADSFTLTVK